MGKQANLPVLLVEDNPDHEELIRRAFSDRGALVATPSTRTATW